MTVEPPPADEMLKAEIECHEDKYSFLGNVMFIRDCTKMEAVKWIKQRTNDEVESFVIDYWQS